VTEHATSRHPPWLDPWQPHDDSLAAAQLEALTALLGKPPKRVLDLGCGAGRVLVPLARTGHHVRGVDHDPHAIEICRGRLRDIGADADLLEADFVVDDVWGDAPFHAVCCLGNTFMTITDLDRAITLLRRATTSLATGGFIVIDDLPADFWPELTDGNWQGGLSPDGTAQLVWHPSDQVFVIRTGTDVDRSCWTIRSGEPCFRLWTDSLLRLAAASAGLSAPERRPGTGLLLMRPAG
jgi:SAM-dependent methyltransferase